MDSPIGLARNMGKPRRLFKKGNGQKGNGRWGYFRTACLASLRRKLPIRLPRLRRIRNRPASTK
jgi:hypothetical protein